MKDTKQMDFKIMMGIVYSSLLIEHYDELEEAYKLKLPKKLKGAIYTGKQELEKFGTAIFKNASKQDIEVLLKIAAVLTAFSIGFSNADLNLIQSRHLKPNLTLLGFWYALRRKWTKNVEFNCWRKSTKRIRLEGENGN